MFSQFTEQIFTGDSLKSIRRLNRIIQYALNNPVSIRFPPLDISTPHLIASSDASFANSPDHSTQIGYILFLLEDIHAAIKLHFKSYKALIAVRSVLVVELIAFSYLFDTAHTLATKLLHLLHDSTIPTSLFTNNICLFDDISKGSKTLERRFMI